MKVKKINLQINIYVSQDQNKQLNAMFQKVFFSYDSKNNNKRDYIM